VDALARDAHPPGDLRDGEGMLRERDCAQHLPASARQALARAQQIPAGEEQAVGSKDREDDLGSGFSGWRSLSEYVRSLTTS
jgi:hypothetical protein